MVKLWFIKLLMVTNSLNTNGKSIKLNLFRAENWSIAWFCQDDG